MSPSGGETTVVDQPMIWSPEKSAASSSKAKQRWFDVWPGVCTAASVHPGPDTLSPSAMTRSGA